MNLILTLLIATYTSDISFYFKAGYNSTCDNNAKLSTAGCLKCPKLYIADPLKRQCIQNPNHQGRALGFGDYCIENSGLDPYSFVSHATQFGTGTFPPLPTTAPANYFFKFPCVNGNQPVF